jgi:hypothetical protein
LKKPGEDFNLPILSPGGTKGFLSSIFQWQTGGWIASVSQYGMEDSIDYIRNQKEHHKRKHSEWSMWNFLKTYKVEYEQEYLP